MVINWKEFKKKWLKVFLHYENESPHDTPIPPAGKQPKLRLILSEEVDDDESNTKES